MPLVNVRVDDATRALWVEAAGGEMLTLSEWIRKACDTRLGLADRFVDKPLRLNVEADTPVGEPTDAASVPAAQPPNEPQAPTGTITATSTWPEREFKGPDNKPEPKKKPRR